MGDRHALVFGGGDRTEGVEDQLLLCFPHLGVASPTPVLALEGEVEGAIVGELGEGPVFLGEEFEEGFVEGIWWRFFHEFVEGIDDVIEGGSDFVEGGGEVGFAVGPEGFKGVGEGLGEAIELGGDGEVVEGEVVEVEGVFEKFGEFGADEFAAGVLGDEFGGVEVGPEGAIAGGFAVVEGLADFEGVPVLRIEEGVVGLGGLEGLEVGGCGFAGGVVGEVVEVVGAEGGGEGDGAIGLEVAVGWGCSEFGAEVEEGFGLKLLVGIPGEMPGCVALALGLLSGSEIRHGWGG